MFQTTRTKQKIKIHVMDEYKNAKHIVELYEKELTIKELSFKIIELERRLDNLEKSIMKNIPPKIPPPIYR